MSCDNCYAEPTTCDKCVSKLETAIRRIHDILLMGHTARERLAHEICDEVLGHTK